MLNTTEHNSGLDTVQLRAIESGVKTVIVSGGPGTGKTLVLSRRFAHLVTTRNTPLSSILLLTFSSDAATRFRRSIERMLCRSYDELHIHTYYSLARLILEEHASRYGHSAPTPIVPFREYLVVKEILRQQQPSFRSRLRNIPAIDGLAREISDFLGMLKQNLISADIFRELTRKLPPQFEDLTRIYSAYEKLLQENGWVGVRDAVAKAVEILEHETDLLAHYQGKLQHILADEFQETDFAQYHLVKLLAGKNISLFVTGDEEQRIYRFRGSIVGQLSDIAEGRRDETERIELSKNYRLPPALKKTSENLIMHNRDANVKTPLAASDKMPTIRRYKDAIEQAYGIAREIKCRVLDSSHSSDPTCYSDFAIICRSTVRSALPIEEAFFYYSVPYMLYNSTSFYKHPMVRCVVDLVKFILDPEDDTALFRVLSAPLFGLDPVELRRIANRKSPFQSESLYETLRRSAARNRSTNGAEITGMQTRDALDNFLKYFAEIREQALGTDNPSVIIHSIMSKLFFGAIIENENIDTAIRDSHNLRSLYDVMTDIEEVLRKTRRKCKLEDMADFMEHAFVHFSSQKENDSGDEAADGVKIMTVHQAKGMEFRYVFLVDMTEDNFPLLGKGISLLDGRSLGRLASVVQKHTGARSLDSCSFQPILDIREHLKEERQLTYVAATRASREMTICYPEQSQLSEPVRPSPFIEELLAAMPESNVLDTHSAESSLDDCSLLESALSKQEIESSLRTCAGRLRLGLKDKKEFFAFLESQGLDAEFICEESPFEREQPRPPDLSKHKYSASQLATYLICPRQFFFEKLLRISPERLEDFGLGQLIHLVLEKFHAEVKDFRGKPETLDTALKKTFQTVWQGNPIKDEDGKRDAFCHQYSTILQRETIRRRAEDVLRRYIRTETERSGDKEILACEKTIDFPVRDYPFVAKLDRIDAVTGGHHIIDYKTSSNGPKNPLTIKKKFINVDEKDGYKPSDFQFPLYFLAAESAGFNPSELIYYWLVQEDSSGMFKKSSLHVGNDNPDFLTSDCIRAAEESIVTVVEQIVSGDFGIRPKVFYECRRCSFDFICDAVNKDTEQNGQ